MTATLSRRAADYPPTGQMVPVGQTVVHAHLEGAAEDPVVILVHGASGNSRDFSFDLTGRLAGRYRVIAFDRPGLGHTPALHARGESPQEQARLLDDAAAALGVERAVIVGHSYGAAVAMAWALERPERVAGVVTLGGATMPWQGNLGPWYAIASSALGGATVVPLAATFASDRVARNSIARIFEPDPVPEGYAEYVGVGLSIRPSTLRINARQVNTLKPHLIEMAPRYPTLRIPLEAVHGTADTAVPLSVHSARMVALVPGAVLTELPGVGHMPHHASPEAAVAAIDRVATRGHLR